MTTPGVLLSIIIPLKNEEENVAPLASEIAEAMAGTDYAWEAVWVDDGSTDTTRAELRKLAAPQRYIALDRNHGQSAALRAGVQAAKGTWIGTLDGDRQNDPTDLPKQLAKALAEDLDMCNGIRAKRNDSIIRKISSKIGNGVRNWYTRETVTDVGCSTRVVKRDALLALPFFHGMHRFLPTLVRMSGYTKIAEIPVNHRHRVAGTSKYGVLNRAFVGWRDIKGVAWLLKRSRVWRVVEGDGEATLQGVPMPMATAAAASSDTAATDTASADTASADTASADTASADTAADGTVGTVADGGEPAAKPTSESSAT